MKENEQSILFPDMEFMGERLRPWSFGKFAEVAHLLNPMIETMRRLHSAGIQVEALDERFEELVFVLSPAAIVITSRTIGKKAEEVSEWPPEKGMAVFVEIMRQNWNHLKNLSGLGKTIREIETTILPRPS